MRDDIKNRAVSLSVAQFPRITKAKQKRHCQNAGVVVVCCVEWESGQSADELALFLLIYLLDIIMREFVIA